MTFESSFNSKILKKQVFPLKVFAQELPVFLRTLFMFFESKTNHFSEFLSALFSLKLEFQDRGCHNFST